MKSKPHWRLFAEVIVLICTVASALLGAMQIWTYSKEKQIERRFAIGLAISEIVANKAQVDALKGFQAKIKDNEIEYGRSLVRLEYDALKNAAPYLGGYVGDYQEITKQYKIVNNYLDSMEHLAANGDAKNFNELSAHMWNTAKTLSDNLTTLRTLLEAEAAK